MAAARRRARQFNSIGAPYPIRRAVQAQAEEGLRSVGLQRSATLTFRAVPDGAVGGVEIPIWPSRSRGVDGQDDVVQAADQGAANCT